MEASQVEKQETLPVLLVEDNRVALAQSGKDEQLNAVFKSGVLYTSYNTAFTSYSLSTSNATIFSSGLKMIVSRDIRMKWDITFTITDPNPLAQFTPLYDCPAAFPVNNSMNTVQLSINGQQTTFNSAQLLPALLQYNNTAEWRNGECSTCPAQPDFYQSFEQQFDPLFGGLVNSPFSPIGTNPVECTRAGFNGGIWRTLSVDGKSIRLVVVEPIFCSPLSQKRDTVGLSNINNIQFQFQFQNNIFPYAWSHISAGNVNTYDVNSVTTTINSAPQLLYQLITPTESIRNSIPLILTYPYSKYTIVEQPIANFIKGSTLVNFQAPPIRITSIPNRLYIYCNRNWNSKRVVDSQSFAQISNIQILYNNSSSLLQGASAQELYAISKSNGYIRNYSSFQYLNGSVICIDLSKDVCQAEGLAPGCAAYTQMDISATITNISPNDEPSMYFSIISEFQGVCNVSPDTSYYIQSTLTSFDVEKALKSSDVRLDSQFNTETHNQDDILGGRNRHLYRRKHHRPMHSGMHSMPAGAGLITRQEVRGGNYIGGEGGARHSGMHNVGLPKFMQRRS